MSNVQHLAAGAYHSVAASSYGPVWAWGLNNVGQVGDGTTVDRHAPVVLAGLQYANDLAAGAFHSMASVSPGEVRAWGWNVLGQLGDGTTTDRHSPVRAVDLPLDAYRLTAGAFQSAAVGLSGAYSRWGWIGSSWSDSQLVPTRPVLDGSPGPLTTAAGVYHYIDGR